MPAGSSTGGGWSPTADRSPVLAGRPASGVDLAGPDCELRLHEQLLLELRLLGRELTPTRDAGCDLVVASGEVLQPVDRLSRLAGRGPAKTRGREETRSLQHCTNLRHLRPRDRVTPPRRRRREVGLAEMTRGEILICNA